MPRSTRHALSGYHVKRDFKRTSEPSGGRNHTIRSSEHARFVIQKHDASRLHYDLRLELIGVFKSWAITRGPSLDPGQKRLAVEVEDHPLDYGDFEGTIPAGEYGDGTVMIWDRGFWAPDTDTPVERSLRDGELKLVLAGEKLQGSFVLVRLRRRVDETRINWLLIKHTDGYATPGRDSVLKKDRSVASGRTMTQIATGRGRSATPFLTTKATGDRSAVRSSTAAGVAAMPKLTHPERVLWPDVPAGTKRDLAEYLMAVAPWMLPHIAERPCSFLRAPDGINGEQFFQRHPMAGQPPTLGTVTVGVEKQPYVQIEDGQSLVAMAQFSVLEFHPWNVAPGRPRVPGRLVFDLDPAPDVPFDAVVEAARETGRLLESLGLVAFCKTTGGKGLHVVTPLVPDAAVSWEQAKLFAHTVAAQLAAKSPSRYVTTMAKSKRKGRIFIDYLRNDETATAVAPLSPRARPGATVSMPLSWAQVRKGLDPQRFTIDTVPALIARSKAWTDYDEGARRLRPAIDVLTRSKP